MEHLTIYCEPQPNANIKWYIEVEYLKNIFIEKNHSETLGWYNAMATALPPDDYLTDLAQRYYDGCNEKGPNSLFDENGDREEALKLLTEAIRIAPAHCTVLADCFQLRAKVRMNAGEYASAIADLKACKQMFGSTYHDYVSVLISLIKCFIKTKNKFEAEKTISSAKLHRKRMMKLTKEKTNLNGSMASLMHILKNLERQVRKIDPSSLLPHQNGAESSDESGRIVPYQGFTPIYPKIKNASVACSFIKNQILANRNIPANEVILCEQPVGTERLTAGIQCTVCHNKSMNSISCNECHMIDYCSIECRQSDNKFHKYECMGYKMMVLPLLDAKLVLRLLVRGLTFMQRKVFDLVQTQTVTVTNATELFNLLLTVAHKENSSDYVNILLLDAKYEKMAPLDFEYCTMVSLRLSIYLFKFTSIINDFFKAIRFALGKNEILLFIGALIMRHAAQIKLKVCLLNHTEALSNDNARNSCDKSTKNIDADNWCLTEDQLLNESKANLIRTKFKSFLEKVNGDNGNLSPKDNDHDGDDYTNRKTEIDETRELFERCLAKASQTHSIESSQKRAAFQLYVDEMYKRHFFHHNYGADSNRPHEMRCIYPTLSLIEHSCDPNCAIVVIDAAGMILLKTVREILAGEKISISYGVHYKCDNKLKRHRFLQQRAVECNCVHCFSNTSAEQHMIECKRCGEPIETALVADMCSNGCDKSHKNDSRLVLLRKIDGIRDRIVKSCHNKYSIEEIIAAELCILIGFEEMYGSQSVEALRQHLTIGSLFAKNDFVRLALGHFITAWSTAKQHDLVDGMAIEMTGHLSSLLEMLQHNIDCRKIMNDEFTSLLENVLEFIAQVTESLRQTDGMPKLSCFFNRLVQLRKSFSECKMIAGDALPPIRTNATSPIDVTRIHDDLNIFADLQEDSCEESNSPSEKSF